MSLANESKPDRNSHYVDLLRSAKRLLLPHGYCDFVYSSTVSRGSPDKPDGETIFNVLRCAVHINSGRIIYNFGFQESLRTFLKPIFTRGVVNRNSICNACSLWKQRRCGQSYLFSSTAFPVKIAFGALRRARQTRNIGNSSAIHGQSASGGHSKSSRWMESHIFSKERIKSA